MSYPNREAFARQRQEFLDNGGPAFVQRQILGLDSISRHRETGEPWPAFHRCYICGSHPEAMGDRCVKIGDYLNIPLCEYCVTKIYEALQPQPQPTKEHTP
jgi:hypothetical protein